MLRGWEAGPTDEEADQAELRNLEALARPIFGSIDRQAIAAVLQSEYRNRQAIPVRLVGPAEIRVSGVKLGAFESRLLTVGDEPVQILSADPRRALLVLSQGGVTDRFVVLGRSKAEAADLSGFAFLQNSGGPYVFRFTEELWARANGTAGSLRLSVMTEQWVR